MTDELKPMSATARAVLALATTSNDHLVQLPHLPVAAARQVVRSMLKAGLVEEPPALVDDAGTSDAPPRTARCLGCGRRLGLVRVAEGANAAIAASVSIGTAGEAAAEASLAVRIRTDSPSTTVTPPPEDLPADAAQASMSGWTPPTLDATNAGGIALAFSQAGRTVQEPPVAVEPARRRRSKLHRWATLRRQQR
jgi:hypothetical protein